MNKIEKILTYIAASTPLEEPLQADNKIGGTTPSKKIKAKRKAAKRSRRKNRKK